MGAARTRRRAQRQPWSSFRRATSAEFERFAARTREWARVDEAEIEALEPDLAGRFHKGLFFAREGHLDPRVAMAALRRD